VAARGSPCQRQAAAAMPFKRFVEVGRLCLVTYGPMEGKLCVVVNIIDQSHVLVDGTPAGDAGTPRMGMSLKRMMLTDLKVPIKLNATAKKLKEAWDAEGTMAAWEESSWAQKRKRHITRKGLSDFARFEAMLARKERSAARAKKM